MIEYAINDLMQQMNRHPPAIIADARPFQRGSQSSKSELEAQVAAFSKDVDSWIEGLHSDLNGLWKSYEGGKVESRHLDQLNLMIKLFDENVAVTAKEFKRYAKSNKKIIGSFKTVAVSYRVHASQCSKEWFSNLARWELARAEVVLSIRALRAKYFSKGNQGPVFSDSKSLGDYLRAATA